MANWGMEEQLLAAAKEVEGALGDEGVRRPHPSGQWLDVLSDARKQ
jgi:hypothetical protein